MRQKPNKIKKENWDSVNSSYLSEEHFTKMKPVHKNHPEILRGVRGSQKSPTKNPVSICLSSDVVDSFKSKGKGWQGNIDTLLDEYVKSY